MNRLLTLGSFPAVVMAPAILAAVALVVDGAALSAQLTPLPASAAAKEFAKAVNIDYRPLSDGSIDHSSSLVLLNESGRVLTRSGEADDPTKFIAAVRQAVKE